MATRRRHVRSAVWDDARVVEMEPALLIAISGRVLSEARDICEQTGSVALAVLEEGDLERAAPGTTVLILAVGEGDAEQRTVGWRASLRGWTDQRPSDGVPSTLDPEAVLTTEDDRSDEDEDEDEEDELPPVWIELNDLRELEMRERFHTNELVRKRDRGARFFVPRAPRLVRLPA